MLLYVHRDRRLIRDGSPGRPPRLSHSPRALAVCTVVECCLTSTETVDLLGTGAQDVHLDFYTALELCHMYVDDAELRVLGYRLTY